MGVNLVCLNNKKEAEARESRKGRAKVIRDEVREAV